MRRAIVVGLLAALVPASAGAAALGSAETLAALRAPAGLDALLWPAAAAAAATVLAWLLSTTLLVVVRSPRDQAHPAGPARRTAARRLAALLLGAGLTVVTAGPASALGPPPAPAAVAAHLDRPATDLRGWTPDRPAASVVARTRPQDAPPTEVVVHRGDSLWAIAERHAGAGATAAEVAAAWPRWYRANRDRVGADPDLLLPGTRLRVPASADPTRGAS